MFGVFKIGLPVHERSPYPVSSTRIKITLGFFANAGADGASAARQIREIANTAGSSMNTSKGRFVFIAFP